MCVMQQRMAMPIQMHSAGQEAGAGRTQVLPPLHAVMQYRQQGAAGPPLLPAVPTVPALPTFAVELQAKRTLDRFLFDGPRSVPVTEHQQAPFQNTGFGSVALPSAAQLMLPHVELPQQPQPQPMLLHTPQPAQVQPQPVQVQTPVQVKPEPKACKACPSQEPAPAARKKTVRPKKPSTKDLPLEQRKKYICKICNRGFTTSGHLARHYRIHTGEKRHVCPFPGCNQRFSRHDNCVQHYKTHFKNGAVPPPMKP